MFDNTRHAWFQPATHFFFALLHFFPMVAFCNPALRSDDPPGGNRRALKLVSQDPDWGNVPFFSIKELIS